MALTFAEIGTQVARNTRRAWSNPTHAQGIRQSINRVMDNLSEFGTLYFRMTDATLSLGNPPAAGTRYIALPLDFGAVDPGGMRRSGLSLPMTYYDHASINQMDPTWASNSSPDYWGVIGRNFFFYPRISATFVSGGGAIYVAYSQALQHVADDGIAVATGVFPDVKYGDADYPDLPYDSHENLIDGASWKELDIRRGPGAGREYEARWLAFCVKMTTKTAVIGGGGSPYIRHSRRNLVGSSMR